VANLISGGGDDVNIVLACHDLTRGAYQAEDRCGYRFAEKVNKQDRGGQNQAGDDEVTALNRIYRFKSLYFLNSGNNGKSACGDFF